MSWFFIISCLTGYFIGAIPTGYWLGCAFFNVDITQYGSKNIGATNFARVLGNKKYFFIIFLLDFFKAFGLLWSLYFISEHLHISLSISQSLFIASCLIIGNGMSVFLNFKGGKGVSTTAATLAYLMPFWFPFIISFFILILYATKRVDVAALSSITGITCIHFLPFFHTTVLVPFLIFATVWSFWCHKNNLVRIYESQGW